jgi:hypothetical protein
MTTLDEMKTWTNRIFWLNPNHIPPHKQNKNANVSFKHQSSIKILLLFGLEKGEYFFEGLI